MLYTGVGYSKRYQDLQRASVQKTVQHLVPYWYRNAENTRILLPSTLRNSSYVMTGICHDHDYLKREYIIIHLVNWPTVGWYAPVNLHPDE